MKQSKPKKLQNRVRQAQEALTNQFTVSTRPGFSHLSQVGPLAFPNSFTARLRYCDLITLSTTGSVPTVNTYAFRLNSLYDPDVSGTGHQPYQFDQLAAIYTRYLVVGATVSARFRNNAGNSDLWVGVNIQPDTDLSGSMQLKTVSACREFQNVWMRPLGFYDDRISSVVYKTYVDIPKAFALTLSELTGQRNNYGAVTSSNPARELFLQLGIADIGSSSSKSISVDVEIVYHVEMYGYQSVAGS